MFCKKCGYSLSNTDTFCPKCGYRNTREISEFIPQKESNKNKFSSQNIFSTAVVVVVVIFVYAFIVNNNNDSNSTNKSYSDNGFTTYERENDVSYYFDQLSFGNVSIKTGSINDTVYVKVKNNSTVTFDGSIKAYIYKNGNIIESAVLTLPPGGLSPGDTAIIDGIFNTINGKYDDIIFEPSAMWIE